MLHGLVVNHEPDSQSSHQVQGKNSVYWSCGGIDGWGQGQLRATAATIGILLAPWIHLVVSEKLAPYGFVRIHRSTLVNRHLRKKSSPGAPGDTFWESVEARNTRQRLATRKT